MEYARAIGHADPRRVNHVVDARLGLKPPRVRMLVHQARNKYRFLTPTVHGVPDGELTPLALARLAANRKGARPKTGVREVQPRAAAAWRQRQSGDDGHLVARASTLIQDRGVAAGHPRAPHDRGEEQTTLVDEHQTGVQAPGLFLKRDRSTFTHRWIAASSRSRARRSGVWGLQPRVRRTRPIHVVPHAELAAHHLGDAGARPERRAEPRRLSAAQQHALQPGAAARVQLGGAARCRLRAQDITYAGVNK